MEATMTRQSKIEIAEMFKSLPPMVRKAFAIGMEAGKLQAESQQAENDRA